MTSSQRFWLSSRWDSSTGVGLPSFQSKFFETKEFAWLQSSGRTAAKKSHSNGCQEFSKLSTPSIKLVFIAWLWFPPIICRKLRSVAFTCVKQEEDSSKVHFIRRTSSCARILVSQICLSQGTYIKVSAEKIAKLPTRPTLIVPLPPPTPHLLCLTAFTFHFISRISFVELFRLS